MSVSEPPLSVRAERALHDLQGKSWMFIALGVLFIVLGFIAAANLMVASVAAALYVGVLMLAAGVAQIVHAFAVRGWSAFLVWLLGGLLYAAAGLVAIFNPALAAVTLTFVLALCLVAAGAIRIVTAIAVRRSEGWGWLLLSGVVTTLAGVVIALGWPVNGLFILGILLALDLVFQGLMAVLFGLALRRLDRATLMDASAASTTL